jgi:diketogulonate reductase-like aldo/keto reductase
MPTLGIGVAELSDAETERAVSAALELGCRLIDTAKVYGNEAAVGRAIAASGVPRDELFVTTKLANADQGLTAAIQACHASVERLGLDYVDLYLIHWPAPPLGMYVDSFGGLIQAREQGLTRSIGVCNFTAEHLDDAIDLAFETPAVNQIELHPLFPQQRMREVNAGLGIRTESWSPLGKRQAPFEEPAVRQPAEKYDVSPGQVILRWQVQLGAVPIPKSRTPERQRQNLDVFGFELTDDEMAAITALGRPDGRLFGGDPDTHEEQ